MSEYVSIRTLTISLAFAVVLIAIALRLFSEPVVNSSPDEFIYTNQAKFILEHGLDGYQILAEQHNQDKNLWFYPSPLRVGYTYPLGLFYQYFNTPSPNIGAYLSLLFSCLNLILILIVGLRYFCPVTTLLALIFISTSPIDLELARRCWQDSTFGFFVSVIIFLFLELNFKQQTRVARNILLIGFSIAGSYLCLIKENGILFYSFFVLLLLTKTLFVDRKYRFVIYQIVLFIFCFSSLTTLYLYLFKDLNSIMLLVKHTKEAMSVNEYITVYQNTSSREILESLLKITPGSFVCFSIALITVLWRQIKQQTFDLQFYFSIISLILFLMICSIDYLQNLRYLSAIFMPYYILAGIGFYGLIKVICKLTKNEYLIISYSALIFIGSFYDYSLFKDLFIEKSIGDLAAGWILKNW